MKRLLAFTLIIIMCMPAITSHNMELKNPYISIVNDTKNTIIQCNNGSILFMTKCSKPSYIKFKYPYNNYTEYSFGLSWSNNYDYGRTENSILITGYNNTLLNISYGPYLCYNTLICNSRYDSINLSKMNYIYYFNIFISNGSDNIYLIFNSTIYKLHLRNVYNGNLSIMFGGEYSDQRIYNFESKPFNIFNNNLIKYKCKSFSVNKNINNAIIARSINTLFYINNNSLNAYNYYNKSEYKILNISGNIFYQDSKNIILFSINKNVSMITISKLSGNITIKHFTNHGYIYAYFNSGVIFLNRTSINYNGNIININGTIIGAYHDKSLFVIYKSGKYIYLSRFENNTLDNIYNLDISNVKITGINDGTSLWPFIFSNGAYINMLPEIPYISKSPLLLYNGTSFLHNSYFYSSNGRLNINGNVSIDKNTIVTFNKSTFKIYYINRYLSNYYPKINSIVVKRHFNYNTIYINVSSYIKYSAVLKFDSKSFNINKVLKLNLSNVPQGIYNSCIIVTNIAGYKSEKSVDIYSLREPYIYVYPANNSYIIYNQTIKFSVDEFNLKYINVKYGNQNMTFYGNGSFKLSLGNYTGNITIRFTALDSYNLVYYKNVTYHVMKIPKIRTNIYNNEYFNINKIYISWEKIKNATYYIIKINNQTYKTLNDNINITLQNGSYNLSFYIVLKNSISIPGPKYHIIVMAYRPRISYKINTDYISFYGNSRNNTLNISVKLNMPALLNGTFEINNRIIFTYLSKHFKDFYFINVTGSMANFSLNGLYKLILKIHGINGLESNYTIYFYVNNSIPNIYKNIIYYTEKPYFNMSLNSNYSYYLNNSLFNGTIHLKESNKIYNFTIIYYSKTGNHNIFHIKIYYFTERPYIYVYHKLINNTLYMKINIKYPVKSYMLIIEYMNKSVIIKKPKNPVYFNISFNSNGFYKINIIARSLFNTESSFNINTSINYFVKIYKYKIEYDNGILKLIIGGENTKNIVASWFVNGKYVGSGHIIKYSLPLGYDNVTIKLSFDGKSVLYTKYIIVTGSPFYYILALIIVIAGILLYKKIRYKNKDITNFIISMDKKPLKEVYKLCKRYGISRHALKKEIQLLRHKGYLEIEEDMDGEMYIIITQK